MKDNHKETKKQIRKKFLPVRMEREEKPQRHKGYKERKETKRERRQRFISPQPRQGRMKIAQRFIAGSLVNRTTQSRRDERISAVPTGLRRLFYRVPSTESAGLFSFAPDGAGE